MPAKKKSMNAYLEEVFKQYVAVKDEVKSRRVFEAVFDEVVNKMRDKCQYFKKYGKEVMYAGSVYDGIKVSKLDEFDMDIVIRLPICKKGGPNGIILENDLPGYVKMKIVNAFDNLDKQKDWEDCHVITREWRDEEKYFVQNEFRNWIHGLVHKALNEMGGRVTVGETTYLVTYRESGPAYTLNVRNVAGSEEFILDVDLVPVIKFSLPRWPEGYRQLGHSICKEWLVVPKPNKALDDQVLKNRCWRLSFQEFEREIMKGCHQLKVIIRLVKKLRDVLGFKSIPSYFIKTLFLWEVYENKNKCYWEGKISNLFLDMVVKLRNAIKTKEIRYFWNDKLNLIANLDTNLQEDYVYKLDRVEYCIRADFVDRVVSFLLTEDELEKFENSDFYKQGEKFNEQPTASCSGSSTPGVSIFNESRGSMDPESQGSTDPESRTEPTSTFTKSVLGLPDHVSVLAQIASLNVIFIYYLNHCNRETPYEDLKNLKNKYHELEEKIWKQGEKLEALESEKGYHEKFEALSSTFNKLMDKAEKNGLMLGCDGEPKRWKIKYEDVKLDELTHFYFDDIEEIRPIRNRNLSGLLGDTTNPDTSTATFDDSYRPGIGDGGPSVKYKLFNYILSVMSRIGSSDNTGIQAINP